LVTPSQVTDSPFFIASQFEVHLYGGHPVQSTVHELGSSTIYPPIILFACDLVSKVPKFPNFSFIFKKIKFINNVSAAYSISRLLARQTTCCTPSVVPFGFSFQVLVEKKYVYSFS
jgi:hypothetical protein